MSKRASGLTFAVTLFAAAVFAACSDDAGSDDGLGDTQTTAAPTSSITTTSSTTTTTTTSTTTTSTTTTSTTTTLAPERATELVGTLREQFGNVLGQGDTIDLRGELVAIDLGADHVQGIVNHDGDLWAAIDRVGTELLRLDAAGEEVEATRLPAASDYFESGPLLSASGSLWLPMRSNLVHRVDPTDIEAVESVNIGGTLLARSAGPFHDSYGPDIEATGDEDGIWLQPERWTGVFGRLVLGDEEISVLSSDDLGEPDFPVVTMASAHGSLWIGADDAVLRLDPMTLRVDVVYDLQNGLVRDLVATDDAMWVVAGEATLRIDPVAEEVVATIPLATLGVDFGVVVGDDLFVLSGNQAFRIDMTENTAEAQFQFDVHLMSLATTENHLWGVGGRRGYSPGDGRQLYRVSLADLARDD